VCAGVVEEGHRYGTGHTPRGEGHHSGSGDSGGRKGGTGGPRASGGRREDRQVQRGAGGEAVMTTWHVWTHPKLKLKERFWIYPKGEWMEYPRFPRWRRWVPYRGEDERAYRTLVL